MKHLVHFLFELRLLVLLAFVTPLASQAQTLPEDQRLIPAGIINSAFLNSIHRGELAAALDQAGEGRLPAYAAYVALALAYRDDVRSYGDECIFPGDTRANWDQLRGDGTTTSSEVYLPPAHMSFFRTAIDAVGFTPGLNFIQDMNRLFRQEGCNAPSLARLRENLVRAATGAPPVTTQQIAAAFPGPAPRPATNAADFDTDDWRILPSQCYANFMWTQAARRGTQGPMAYCVCFGRMLREAGEVELYNAFLDNWNRAQDAHWSGNDAISGVTSSCNQRTEQEDFDRAAIVLEAMGLPVANRRQ